MGFVNTVMVSVKLFPKGRVGGKRGEKIYVSSFLEQADRPRVAHCYCWELWH